MNRTYKKINCVQLKHIDGQHCNNSMELIKETHCKKTFPIQNDSEIKQNDDMKKYNSSQFNTHNPGNLHSLHDPYDLNHIHGHINCLFKTFNEFANILENALLPPVLKIAKKLQIKISEFDQQANKSYIVDLNTLFSEIKIESKNEKLQTKKNKTNIAYRKMFQIKLIQCYKLAITTTKVCSKTLEDSSYNPIQSNMKKLIQIISGLSLITGKYIYGELFKKKKKESFDLIQRCNTLESMLEKIGYKDTEHEVHSNNIHDNNTLNELSSKALMKYKTELYSVTSKQLTLSMYEEAKPKLGTCYAQNWPQNKDILEEHSYNGKMINEEPVLLKQNSMLLFDNIFINDNLGHPLKESNTNGTNKPIFKDIENKRSVYDDADVN